MKKRKKHNIKKIIIYEIFFLLIIFISYYIFTIRVKAGENDSELIKNYTGYYVYVNFNNQDHGYNAIRYTMNNKTVYCIELGTDINSYIYSSTDNLQSSGLTAEQIQYIKLLSYYGYDYQNHSNNIYYYLATQELIWSYLNPTATFKWIESKNEPDKILNFTQEKKEILTLIESHLKKPILKNNINVIVGDSITIEDANNLISNYYMIDNKVAKSVIDNNKITIIPDGKYLGTFVLTFKEKEEYKENSILYYYDNSQKMISAGTIEPNSIDININIKGAIIYLQKLDKDNNSNISSGEASLKYAEYKIYDENNYFAGYAITSDGGLATTIGLRLGKYYIKESKPSKGYLINEDKEEIIVDKSQNYFTTYDEVIKSKIEILKLYGYDNEKYQYPESNITFNIYDKNNNLFKTAITDKNGYTDFELPYGSYTIKQQNTTEGYNKIDDIRITIDENSEKTIRYNLLDKDLTTYLKIIKTDSESELPILNNHAFFKIKDTNGNYIKYKGKDIFETDDKGEIIIPIKLSYGTYEIEEIQAPKNYQKENIITITIDNDSNFYYNDKYGQILDIKLLNTINKCSLNIIKEKEVFIPENNNFKYEFIPDNNSKIELYAQEDIITPDNKKHYSKDEVIKTIVTNNNGTYTINNLYCDNYCVREINKNDNYLNNKDKCINLKESNSINIKNYLKKGTIKITKTDKETGIFLKDAIIELYQKDDFLINTSMTNNKGIIEIDNIPFGEYYIKEKKAPTGYNLDDTKYNLKVDNDNNNNIYITNSKIKNIKPSHTGISKNNILIISIILFLLYILKTIIKLIIKDK